MTPPVDDPEALRHILTNTEALLLDFDGPICSVFSTIPDYIVADQLRDLLRQGGHKNFPEDVLLSGDPFDVLSYAHKLSEEEARHIEASFCAHEVEAVQSAESTPLAAELMRRWNSSGRTLGVVSNNSVHAVETYLSIHELSEHVDVVSARRGADISLLKPSPFLIVEALTALRVDARSATMVGDSATDIEAAHAAEVKIIAFANKADKILRFTNMSPNVIVTDLSMLPLDED